MRCLTQVTIVSASAPLPNHLVGPRIMILHIHMTLYSPKQPLPAVSIMNMILAIRNMVKRIHRRGIKATSNDRQMCSHRGRCDVLRHIMDSDDMQNNNDHGLH